MKSTKDLARPMGMKSTAASNQGHQDHALPGSVPLLQTIQGEPMPITSDVVSEELLRSLVNGSDDAIISKTLEGLVTSWNPAAETMFGYQASEIIGQSVLNLFPEELLHEEREIISRIASGERIHHYETIRKRKDGSTFPASITVSPIRDERQAIVGASKIVRDITIKRALVDEMRMSASVFEFAREAIIIADDEGRFIRVNKAFSDITGYTAQDVVGQTPNLFKSSRQGPEVHLKMLIELKDKGFCQGEVWSRKKSGQAFAALVNVTRVNQSGGLPDRHIAIFADITAIREQQELMERMAHFDLLTNLPNRFLLTDRLEQALKKCDSNGGELAVVYADLDGFKQVNDDLGHALGDEVLTIVSKRMQAALEEGDTIARIGGDEFVILLMFDRPQKNHLDKLRGVLDACKQPIQIEHHHVSISATAGVTVYPADESTAELLLRHADQAMYEAKQIGKNRIKFFDAIRDKNARDTYSLIQDLEVAIERDALFLEYQPKVDLLSGRIVGAEALLRWRRAQDKTVYPDEFIRPVEQLPIIEKIGGWVMRQALLQLEQLHALGFDFPISINIAPRHFLANQFSTMVQDMVNEHESFIRDKRLLEIEIIETQEFSNLAKVARIMNECIRSGVRFSLDDFGTGYSSLAYLKELPVETLKIDRSFIAGMTHNQPDLLLVKGIIGLAKAFNLEIVAEGTEQRDQAELLASLGCAHVQGYGVARPMPAPVFQKWCRRWSQHAQKRENGIYFYQLEDIESL